MNQANFLAQLEGLITGDGFVREVPVPLSALINTSGTALALASNVAVLYLNDTNDSVTFQIQLPLDYDESKDELAVCLTALLTTGDMSAETPTITLDLDQVNNMRLGASAADDISADVTSDAQSVDDEAIAQYTWDLSGLSLKRGDCLSIEVDSTEVGTSEAAIYGASFRYRTDLVAFNTDERSDVAVKAAN